MQPQRMRVTPGIGVAASCLLASVIFSLPGRAGNVLDHGDAFERWSTFRGVRVTPNAGTAPDGSLTADQIHDSATENGGRVYSNTIVANGGPYVFTCYLKAGTLSQAKLAIADGSGSSVRGYIQPTLTGQWQRYQVGISNSPAGQTLRVELYPGRYDKDDGYVWAWGAQLEPGTTPSPYTGGEPNGGSPDTTPPATPTGLTAQVSGASIQVSWQANSEPDLAGYRLQRSASGGGFTDLAQPQSAGYTDGSVTPGVAYAYRVAAVDTSGNVSAYSTAATATVPVPDSTPPPVPTGLQAMASAAGVQLQWNPVSAPDLACYRLERGTNGGAYATVAEPETTGYQDHSVQPGTSYAYRVRAVDTSGNASAASNVATVSLPLPPAPAPPTGNNLIQYPEEFEKWESFREASAVANAGAAPNGTATADRVVDSLTQNGGHLYSNNVVSEGGPYTLSCYFKAGTLNKVKLALFDASGDSVRGFVEPNLTVNWQRYTVTVTNVPKGALIRAAIYPGKFDKEDGYIWAWGAQLEKGSVATEYGAPSGGDGQPGPEDPTDTTAPAAPTGVSAQLVGSAIQVQWTANQEPDLAGYRLERGVNSTSSFSTLVQVTAPAHVDTSVQAGNSYSYRVRAVDTAGNLSNPSAVVTVAVPPAEPAPAGALNVLNFGANPAFGGDDTNAIQAAFTAAGQQNKDVYLPAGHYYINRTVVFQASGRTIFGDGMTRTVLAGNTNAYNLIQLDRTQGVVIRDLRLEGSALNNDQVNVNRAVDCYATRDTVIRRVHCYGAGYLAFDNGGVNTVIEDSVIEDYGRIGYLANDGAVVRRCRFICRESWNFTGEQHGVYAPAGRTNILIEDNEFINCGSYAIQLWGSQSGVWTENITIRRNTFTRCKNVLVVGAGSSGPSYRSVRFLANTIRQTQEKDIRIMKFNGSTAQGTELLIEGNIFEDPGASYGFMVINYGGANITGVRVRNNQFLCPGRASYSGIIHLQQSEGTLSDFVVEENLFQNLGHSGGVEKGIPGIWIRSGSGITVQDNTFVHWSGAGKLLDVDAVRLEAAARNVAVRRNFFQGTGLSRCYGVRVPSGGNSATGSITANQFVGARLEPGGVPASGNTVQ